MSAMRVGITFGTFDLLHVGHISILERSKALCDYLVVGVSTDELNFSKKGTAAVYSEEERLKIVSSLRDLTHVRMGGGAAGLGSAEIASVAVGRDKPEDVGTHGFYLSTVRFDVGPGWAGNVGRDIHLDGSGLHPVSVRSRR